ncbi:hypothetical protein [Nodosilinea sp. P-1105]|uniref:hypothetical protein n=1 Tax=Nodosilinea sp. P-1105 TaxID=2546229 RepID=UPI00146B1268|nr:hypothetical protein [Nodosilinea sp. P-1105]NMF82699.1 hypothetical protein [Nodosilinea sp. P-1105]
MRRRSERQKDFESIQRNLYDAGVSTVKAAKAHEEMFTTTLEALAEAYEVTAINQLSPSETDHETATAAATDLTPIINRLLAARQSALEQQDYTAYVDTEAKLQHLDELAVTRLERQVRLFSAQQQLAELSQPKSPERWTESALKAKYGTFKAVKAAFDIKSRSWSEAVETINRQSAF